MTHDATHTLKYYHGDNHTVFVSVPSALSLEQIIARLHKLRRSCPEVHRVEYITPTGEIGIEVQLP